METIPKPLFQRLVLTLLVGTGCLTTGTIFYFYKNDAIFLLLSIFVFLSSICKAAILFLQIIRKSYTMIEGTCLGIRRMPLYRCKEVTLEERNGKQVHLLLNQSKKIHMGICYRIYLKDTPKTSHGQNPLIQKAIITDNLIGIEHCTPPNSNHTTSPMP